MGSTKKTIIRKDKQKRQQIKQKSPAVKQLHKKRGGLRKIKKDTPTTNKKMKASKAQVKKAVQQNRGVVYFSHLPHGFYETELTSYCKQFGTVTGAYVPRSDKGNSKGYAFVEFMHPEVADVVAETMNNYLMFNRLIQAKVVPIENQRPWIFTNKYNAVEAAQKKKDAARDMRERILTPKEEIRYQKREAKKVTRLQSKLKAAGFDYEFTVTSE